MEISSYAIIRQEHDTVVEERMGRLVDDYLERSVSDLTCHSDIFSSTFIIILQSFKPVKVSFITMIQ